MTSDQLSDDLRVLIYAPIGRDAELTHALLQKVGIASEIMISVRHLCESLVVGAGAVLLTEEALSDPEIARLAEVLESQPPWSDVSILLFAGDDRTAATLQTLRTLEVLRNVTLLDRPLRVAAVISTIQAALRGRRRQYELRDVLVALHTARTEAETANRLKDEFLATLSHELRTPLNAILGWVSMLRRSQVAAPQVPRVLEIVERNAQSQAQLVADVLDVSRMITGRIRLQLEPVAAAAIANEAIDTVRPSADAKGVELRVDLRADQACVNADAQRLNQVFWNLLSNAVKFTPSGGRVTVGLREEAAELVFEVADTGIGLSPQFLPHAFDRFRQGDQTFTRAHGGLGLGLAIVKHLVEMHGGQVSAASEGLGKGAVFSVRLPVAAIAARELAPDVAERAEYPEADFAGNSILVVDDDATTRELVAAMLHSRGARVRAVGSAAAALAELDLEVPALILADLGMPDEDGLTLIRRIRQRPAARGGQTRAVALSAYARVEDRRAALEAGYDDFLTKPALPAEVIRTVQRWLPPVTDEPPRAIGAF
jgi:signal transduction histidine kinase/CheY-like chemotaxis protein